MKRVLERQECTQVPSRCHLGRVSVTMIPSSPISRYCSRSRCGIYRQLMLKFRVLSLIYRCRKGHGTTLENALRIYIQNLEILANFIRTILADFLSGKRIWGSDWGQFLSGGRIWHGFSLFFFKLDATYGRTPDN